MPQGKPPVVTGLSPKEGVPGTQITIRGENLGMSQTDIVGLSICGTDCLMSARWDSSHKVVARCGQAKGGLGEVILFTRSGGKGTSTVMFRVYTVQIGPLQESAVWIDESRTVPGREIAAAGTSGLIDEDPLGISDERDDGKRSMNGGSLADLYPEGSANLRLENFVPVWYLLENHKNASFVDLKNGLAFMKRQSSSMNEGPKDLLRTNLYSFLSCVDSLASLQQKLETQKHNKKWPITKTLENQVEGCRTKADALFSDVLGRKDRADSTRSALSVLQRFKFLFFLPQTIRKNLEKGDYSVVLNDYTRAKSLFGEADVPLFKEALSEVEKEMIVFQEALNDKLLEMPSSLNEQKKIIRYLLMLEPDSDPGWDCLTAHFHWLQGVLWDSQEKHWRHAKRDSVMAENESDQDDKLMADIPQRYMFLENIIAELSTKLQHFWKLAQAYINGQLSARQNLHREEEIEQMVIQIVNLASWLILNALLPESLPGAVKDQYGDRFVNWPVGKEQEETARLLQGLRDLRGVIGTLSSQDFREKHLHHLMELCVSIRLKCLSRIIDRTVYNIAELHTKDNWKIQRQELDYSKTQLPDLFENQVAEILPFIRQILSHTNFPGELNLFTADAKMQEYLLETFERLLGAFRETLERVARLGNTGFGTGQGTRPTHIALGDMRKESVLGAPVKDKKLLMGLADCDYVLRFSLDSLGDRLSRHGLIELPNILDACRKSYTALRSVLLKAYTVAKCSPFSNLIFPVDYTAAKESVKDVSNYVKDLVLCVVSVQAELFLVAPHFTVKVSRYVVRACAEQMAAHIKETDENNLTQAGINQIAADHIAFEESVGAYLAQDTKHMLHSSRSSIVKKCDQELVQKCLHCYRNRMRLTLVSLQEHSTDIADV